MPKIGPIMAYKLPFHITQRHRFRSPLSKSIAAPPLSYPSTVPASSTISTVVSVPQEDTVYPTGVNQHATKMDSPSLDDQHSQCTCSICRRELHGPLNAGGESEDREHGYHCKDDVGGSSSSHGLKRCTALRRPCRWRIGT